MSHLLCTATVVCSFPEDIQKVPFKVPFEGYRELETTWRDWALCSLGNYPLFWGYVRLSDGMIIWTNASITGQEFDGDDFIQELVTSSSASVSLQNAVQQPYTMRPPRFSQRLSSHPAALPGLRSQSQYSPLMSSSSPSITTSHGFPPISSPVLPVARQDPAPCHPHPYNGYEHGCEQGCGYVRSP